MPVHFRRIIPVLRIFDFPRARQFYIDFLGFRVDGEEQADRKGPRCTKISRGGVALHLSSHHGDGTSGSKIYFDMSGLDQLHREITYKQPKFWRPGIAKNPWGTRSMEVGDPFGNRLFFTERIPAKRTPTKKGRT